MANKTNPRRKKGKRSETGPRWESQDPGAGANATHVARARQKWKRVGARTERRTGTTRKFAGQRRERPAKDGDPER
jgi:hypothetical protein